MDDCKVTIVNDRGDVWVWFVTFDRLVKTNVWLEDNVGPFDQFISNRYKARHSK